MDDFETREVVHLKVALCLRLRLEAVSHRAASWGTRLVYGKS